jgi:hypothetical protein
MLKAAGLEHLADDAIVVMEKHHPPSGSRHESRRCSHTGLQGDWVYGGVDEHIADRGVHPDPADRRDRRAPVRLADGNAMLSARFLKSHASQKPACGVLSQPGPEHADSWYRAFLTQVGPWP